MLSRRGCSFSGGKRSKFGKSPLPAKLIEQRYDIILIIQEGGFF